MTLDTKKYDTCVLGTGPAGLGLLVAADANGQLNEFLDRGVAFVDKGRREDLGVGFLSALSIRSNSAASEFWNVSENGVFGELFSCDQVRRVLDFDNEIVRLDLVADLLRQIGLRAAGIIDANLASDLLSCRTAQEVHCVLNEDYCFVTKLDDGSELRSRNVVFASGARERRLDFGKWNDKTLLSSEVIRNDYEFQGDTVLVFGGSHSAFSAAWKILQDNPSAGVKIYSLEEPKIFYESVVEADADGYQYSDDDICQVTGRLNRYGGIRGDAKDLYLKIVSGDDKRVEFILYEGDLSFCSDDLDDADLIVSAVGYRPNVIPIFGVDGDLIGPGRDCRGGVLLDDFAGIADFDHQHIDGVYGIGHGFGLSPSRLYGGEISALRRGVRIDSVNVFHTITAQHILNKIL